MTNRRMNLTTLKNLAMVAMLLASIDSHAAGAFGQLQQMGGSAGSVPPVSGPECVSGCDNSSGSSGSGSSDAGEGQSRGIFNWIDIWKARSEAAAEARRVEARQQNERGVAAYKRGDYAEALRLFQLAERGNGDDAVIRQNVKNAAAAVAKIEQKAKAAAERRQAQSEYGRRMQELTALMPSPKTTLPPAPESRQAGRGKPPPVGFTTTTWRDYQAAQEIVERLYAKRNRDGTLSDADAKEFFAALQWRNRLWADATAQPLDATQRARLVLTLPVVVAKSLVGLGNIMQTLRPGAPASRPAAATVDRRGSADVAGGALAPDPITTAFGADYASDVVNKGLEQGVGEALEQAPGVPLKDGYERLLGWGKIAVKAREGGLPAAGAETADLVIAQMPEPLGARAEQAVAGGRIYSSLAYRALDKFMTDAMKATGGTFDSEAFWQGFNESLTQAQKGMKEWIQFGQ